METKIDLLLKAANVIETKNYNRVCSESWLENKRLYTVNPQTRISKINKLLLKRGFVARHYVTQLNEIIMGFNRDLHFLKENKLEVVYLDQLIEIGHLIKNLTFIENSKLNNYKVKKGMKRHPRKSHVKHTEKNKFYFNKKSH